MSKMTAEHVEECRAHAATGSATLVDQEYIFALCDLAKLALTPPQDVAGLVEELRYRQQPFLDGPTQDGGWEPDPLCQKAADAILSLSARNRELEAENAEQAEMIKVLIEEKD